jgi:hypothetical protein
MQPLQESFDSETVALMGRVCDAAWEETQGRLTFITGADPSGIRHLFALRILVAVAGGERNPDRLRKIALARLDA